MKQLIIGILAILSIGSYPALVSAAPVVTIMANDPTATEAGATTGQFTVSRTDSTASSLTVKYDVTGTATSGIDYRVLSGSVTILAGSAMATITVTPIDDTVVEAPETVIAKISANDAYTIGTQNSAKVTITSDDVLPTITSFTPTSGEEGTVVTINGTNLTGTTAVKFNGTATTIITNVTATSLKANVPSGATTGKISG